ncbi:MAG TPA: DUF1629 domain-containing protein [Archangium sp.]|jgi:hypothetical protein|uniref:imm11 family protein n=1 Tax=Archangium sp. TaxID=1872627 RepID=UPI002ED933F8
MVTRYFKLSDDVYVPGRWELGAPLDGRGHKVWTWLFRRGEPAAVDGPIRVPLSHAGEPLDFSVAGAAVPIIHEKVAALFNELAPDAVQLIPVEVESRSEQYFILNILRVVKCIDDAACEEVQHWAPEDGQPDLVGEYRVVAGMRIDPTKVGDAKVFRPWGWPVVLLVSENIKTAMERAGISGANFQDVTST